MPFLSMGDTVSLDNAVTKSEARPHLAKAYKGLESPGINGHVYEIKEDCSCRALEWMRERGIKLRGFETEVENRYGGKLRQSGRVLVELMGFSAQLLKAYEGLESAGFNGHVYQIERDYSCRALKWVR